VELDARWLGLAAIVLFAFGVEATTGFGATVIAVALGAHLLPMHALLPRLVPVGLVLSAYLVLRHRRHVDRRLLLRGVLPPMGIGLALGLALFDRASSATLQRAFGLFVLIVAARELWRSRPGAPASPAPLAPCAHGAALVGAGVIHGLFASGGPLLVYALGRRGLAKERFRATLSSVWLTLGVALLVAYARQGLLDRDVLAASAGLVPVLVPAILWGEWAHRRLDEQRFQRTVFVLLLAAGASNAL
jgi:uncharacterized membrane protein YfcA